jgi:hypothetical protein
MDPATTYALLQALRGGMKGLNQNQGGMTSIGAGYQMYSKPHWSTRLAGAVGGAAEGGLGAMSESKLRELEMASRLEELVKRGKLQRDQEREDLSGDLPALRGNASAQQQNAGDLVRQPFVRRQQIENLTNEPLNAALDADARRKGDVSRDIRVGDLTDPRLRKFKADSALDDAYNQNAANAVAAGSSAALLKREQAREELEKHLAVQAGFGDNVTAFRSHMQEKYLREGQTHKANMALSQGRTANYEAQAVAKPALSPRDSSAVKWYVTDAKRLIAQAITGGDETFTTADAVAKVPAHLKDIVLQALEGGAGSGADPSAEAFVQGLFGTQPAQ